MSVIQPQVDCSSAKDFLDALSPLGAYFKEIKLSESWLFRGQGQDEPLIPSLFRKEDKLASLLHRDVPDYKQRCLAERDVLTRFFDIADKRGLLLPDDSQQLRSSLETLKSELGNLHIASNSGFEEWQTAKMALSLTALAQHYGIPTRLLDWTRQSFIAAFFAAEDAFKHITGHNPSSRLIAWAFLFPSLGKHDMYKQENALVRIVTAPSASNPNLKAQQGVFTLLSPYYTKEKDGSYLPMEEVLEEMSNSHQLRVILKYFLAVNFRNSLFPYLRPVICFIF
jgi:hypothetical protein